VVLLHRIGVLEKEVGQGESGKGGHAN
jgi:hypothetical protein